MVICVTDRCQLNCRHCFKQTLSTHSDLSQEKIVSFLQREEEKNQKVNSIVLTGGETMLYKPLKSLLETLNGQYNVRINTNGLLIDDEWIQFFKTMQKFKIQISLDGYDARTYALIRNTDRFSTVINNAKKLKMNGINVCFKTTITSYTIEHYAKFFDLAKELGIPITLNPIIYTGSKNQEHLLIPSDITNGFTRHYTQVHTYGQTDMKSPPQYVCQILSKNDRMTIYVDTSGDIYACMFLLDNKYCIGNICGERETIADSFYRLADQLAAIFNSDRCKYCHDNIRDKYNQCIAFCSLKKRQCINEIMRGEFNYGRID